VSAVTNYVRKKFASGGSPVDDATRFITHAEFYDTLDARIVDQRAAGPILVQS
jgi:hypothetical protein